MVSAVLPTGAAPAGLEPTAMVSRASTAAASAIRADCFPEACTCVTTLMVALSGRHIQPDSHIYPIRNHSPRGWEPVRSRSVAE